MGAEVLLPGQHWVFEGVLCLPFHGGGEGEGQGQDLVRICGQLCTFCLQALQKLLYTASNQVL